MNACFTTLGTSIIVMKYRTCCVCIPCITTSVIAKTSWMYVYIYIFMKEKHCSWQKHAIKENRFRDTDSLRSNKSSTSAAGTSREQNAELWRIFPEFIRIHFHQESWMSTYFNGQQTDFNWRFTWLNFGVASPPHFLLAGRNAWNAWNDNIAFLDESGHSGPRKTPKCFFEKTHP